MDALIDLIQEENRRIRTLRIAADMLLRKLMTESLTLGDAERMIEGVRSIALHLFPDCGEVFDLIYVPRFRRALREAGLMGRHGLSLVERTYAAKE
jgi:hypothetical protein